MPARRRRGPVRLVVLDVNHTLFDWLAVWARTYRVLIARAALVTGVPPDAIRDGLGVLHRTCGSTEVAAPLGMLPVLRGWHGESPERLAALHDVWRCAVRAGTEALAPYAGVPGTLAHLRRSGTRVVASSQSAAPLVWERLTCMGLAQWIDAIASPSTTPDGAGPWRVIETGACRPDAAVLQRTCAEMRVRPHETTCIGDNLHDHVAVAQAAGAFDVWAAYGSRRRKEDLGLLDHLSHLGSGAADTQRAGDPPQPSVTLSDSLSELLDAFDFAEAPG